MKKPLPALGALALAVALVPAAPAGARAGGARYDGTTSQSLPMFVHLVRLNDGSLALRAVDLEFDMPCDGGDEVLADIEYIYFPGLRLKHRGFQIDDANVDAAFHVTATFGAGTATGTARFTLPGFTAGEALELCTSGDQTWSGTRTRAMSPSSRTPDVTIRVTRHADGLTTRQVLVRGAATRRTPRIDIYKGRTSQHLPLFVATIDREAGTFVNDAEMQFGLTCDDAEQIGYDVSFGFGRTLPLVARHVDTDEVDLFEAFHWHGRIGVHDGSGTVQWAVPGLTPAETAMRCDSGSLDWHVHQTATIIGRRAVDAALRAGATAIRMRVGA